MPIGPGLLYGDERAKGGVRGLDPSQDGELVRMLTWMAAAHPEAAGYWPAQAVGNAALCGAGVIDSVTAMTTLPLFDFTGWDPAVCAAAGVRADQLPGIRSGAAPAGTIGPDLGPALAGAVVGGGTIDAFGEQLVAGADEVGDVLLIMGATLIVWACVADWVEAPGLWTVPHTAPGKVLVGGPSNAGGILKDWAATVLVRPGDDRHPGPMPVGVTVGEWSTRPTCRWCCRTCGASGPPCTIGTGGGRSTGCPSPTDRRPCGAASTRPRATRVRHHLDLAGVLGEVPVARRIVATGGGVRDAAWVQAVADVTGLPVDVVAVPEGGALGSAYLARVAAGLEPDASGASRWARTSHRVQPDPRWVGPCAARHRTFVELTGPPFDPGAGA